MRHIHSAVTGVSVLGYFDVRREARGGYFEKYNSADLASIVCFLYVTYISLLESPSVLFILTCKQFIAYIVIYVNVRVQ